MSKLECIVGGSVISRGMGVALLAATASYVFSSASYSEPPVMRAPENTISFGTAYLKQGVRQAYVNQVARELDMPSPITFVYDAYCAKRNAVCKEHGKVLIQEDGKTKPRLRAARIPYTPGEFAQLVELNKRSNMGQEFNYLSYGQEKQQMIFVHNMAFTTIARHPPEQQEALFRSGIVHERQHATDWQKGVTIKERNKAYTLTTDDVLRLSLLGLREYVFEVRGLGEQLRYQTAQVGSMTDAERRMFYVQCKALTEKREEQKVHAERHGILHIVDAVIAGIRNDPLFKDVIK